MSVSTYADPQPHPRGSPAAVTHRHTGHSRAAGASNCRACRRLQQTQAVYREPHGRRQHFEERDVGGPHHPIVEAPADDQNPDHLSSRTENRHHGDSGCLDDPRRLIARQQCEDRSAVVGLKEQ